MLQSTLQEVTEQIHDMEFGQGGIESLNQNLEAQINQFDQLKKQHD